MGLTEYKRKRNFKKTAEPEGKVKPSGRRLRFVIQKHNASRLHYDFRLEMEGVLKSWAVPKGPSLNPKDKRLAMMVEDHPFDYRDFEGIIPEGNYGAGEVIVWDHGFYHPVDKEGNKGTEKDLLAGLKKGDCKFFLEGEKVRGSFALVKLKNKEDNSWLLIKHRDQFASEEDVTEQNLSVLTGRAVEELKDGNKPDEKVWTGESESRSAQKDSSGSRFKKKLAAMEANSAQDNDLDSPEFHNPPAGAEKLPSAKKAKMPSQIEPMLATLHRDVFDDDNWLYEIKWDGYRAVAEIKSGEVNLHSRNLKSFNKKFSPVVSALSGNKKDMILDGEVIAVDPQGRSSFQLLQNYQRTGSGTIIYYVFDILYYEGYDLRNVPLIERKQFLQSILPKSSVIRYSDHILGAGTGFYEAAKSKNLEGIVAKKANSCYLTSTRSREWLKIKIQLRQEAVICGFTDPKGSRDKFGSLVLGVYENNSLTYVGRSGGGFDTKSLNEIYKILKPIEVKTSPLSNPPKDKDIHWVKPEYVCELSFSEWTDEKQMRHPVFLGIRDDKDPASVTFETVTDSEITSESKNEDPKKKNSAGSKKNKKSVKPDPAAKTVSSSKASSAGKKPKTKASYSSKGSSKTETEVTINRHKLKLTNLDKVYFPDDGYTKGDIINYYRSVAKYILPYLKGRPESMLRHPNGINSKGFFQKDVKDMPPEWIDTIEIYSEHNKDTINYLLCNNEAALVYMANLGCIEINPWFSRTGSLENPDYFVIDLDPEDISFDKVVETALEVKYVLDAAKIPSYPKTSGATGMHIYVPLGAEYDYDVAKDFAHIIANIVHKRIPDITSLERSPKKRQKKVYLDYLQNRKGQTLAAPYSVRPKPGATTAAPLEWDEVKIGLDPGQFDINTMPARLKEKGDLFKKVLGKGIDISKAIPRLEKL